MPNAWVLHVKKMAEQMGITYGCAMSMKEVKDSYKKKGDVEVVFPPKKMKKIIDKKEEKGLTETQKKKLGRFFEKAKIKVSTKKQIEKLSQELEEMKKQHAEYFKQLNAFDDKAMNNELKEILKNTDIPLKKGKPTYDDVSSTESWYKLKGFKFKNVRAKNKTELLKKWFEEHPEYTDKIIDSKQFLKIQDDIIEELTKDLKATRKLWSDLHDEIREKEYEMKQLKKYLEDPNFKEKELLKRIREAKKEREVLQKKYSQMGLSGVIIDADMY